MSLQPLFPLEKQFQGKSGRNLTGGFLLVFLSGTDDPATTYSDYNGTLNPQRIVLDDNGRAVVICDADLYYRLEVYDEEGMLLWTEEPVACTGGGAAAAQVVTVESTDGSVDVTKTVVGSNTYFDLSTKVNPDEPLDWIRAESSGVSDGNVYPAYVAGTMASTNQGIPVVAGRFYHVTVQARVTPDGTGISYDTLELALVDGNGPLCTRAYDIDSSLVDPVDIEFSYDYEAPVDGFIFLSATGTSPFASVDAGVMIHRIYNGYSSEYAKKSWVGSYFVQNSSLGMQSGTITGISGTPIGGISEATVSSIASSYAESAASSKLDTTAYTSYTASALTEIQQDTAAISSAVSSLGTSKVDQSAFDSCCSAVGAQVSSLSSDVSAIRQDTGAISAAVSGLTGEYVQYAALESASGKITGISGTALWGGHEYAGVWPIVVDNTAEKISAANRTLAVDETMTGYASGDSAVIGVNTSTVLSGLTAYQLAADMSGYQPSGDYAYNSSLGDYQPVSGMTAYQPSGDYAYNSAVSSKAEQSSLTAYQEISGMSAYQLSGDYAYNSSLADYQPVSGMTAYQPSGDYAYNSAVSGKQDASAMTAYQLSGDYAYNSSLADYQPVSGMTAYQPSGDYAYNSAVSSKADQSSLADYQPTSAMTDYQLSGDYAYNSSLGDYQPVSGMTAYQPSGNYLVPDDISGKADVSSLTAYQEITGMSAYQLSGDYAYNSAVSSKMDASASSEFYPMTGNPSSFLVADDITGKADASALTAYQEITGMSAYQPSGDYAYNSSLSSYALSADVSGCIDTVSSNSASWGSITSLPITGSAGDDSVVYGETSVEFTRNDSVGEPDYRTASLSTDALSIDYTVDNENYYSMSLREGALEFNSPDGYGIVDIDSISAWNSAYDTVSNESANWAEVSAKADSSALTAYQEVTGMSAYQPAGTYIYESALGWAEV